VAAAGEMPVPLAVELRHESNEEAKSRVLLFRGKRYGKDYTAQNCDRRQLLVLADCHQIRALHLRELAAERETDESQLELGFNGRSAADTIVELNFRQPPPDTEYCPPAPHARSEN
jgi:hypothetical protein